MRWDVFCTVVDNYGDIGTCWRLVQQLADEYQADVRLWIDKLESFACLCPGILTDAAVQRRGSIEVRYWPSDFPIVESADVVIEAFGCELPASYVGALARRAVAPVWINLEYLSAEAWVEECHLLTSPHPSLPLTKTFFFPGFTSKTGGLLRERDLLATRAAFDPAVEAEFWQSVGVPPRSDGELRISLFCYQNAALPDLLQCWADGPDNVLLLASPGAATEQVARWFGIAFSPGHLLRRKSLTVQALPFLSQSSYDRLLWACDVNFVRGEDSFVRAQWAQRPFVWQIYPQTENAHFEKLDAFLTRFLALPQKGVWNPRQGVATQFKVRAEGSRHLFEAKPLREFKDSEAVRGCWQAWNGRGDMVDAWRDFTANRRSIQQHGKDWACQLDRARDLANNLVCFVHGE